MIAWAGLIFFFSSRPAQRLPRLEIPHLDKVVHAGEYAGLGFLLARALRRRDRETLGAGLGALAVALGSMYGASDEYHQTFVPGRSGNDPGDWAADTVGTALGVLVYARLMKKRSWL